MRLAAILSGLTLSLAAGAAAACPSPDHCDGDHYGPPPVAYEQPRQDPYERAYRDGYDAGYEDGREAISDDESYDDAQTSDAPGAWEDERGLYIRGHRGEPCGCVRPPCGCEAGLTLSSGFFEGAGGVGPIPDGGYYGGGGYYYTASSGGSAYAFASARASASVSVRYRGGYGGHKGGGGKHH
jgi:hypothetical protein